MRSVAVLCGLIVLAFMVAGCTQVSQPGPKSVVIGVMPFNEQYILGEIVALLLEKEGYPTEIRSGMNNAALYEAVKAGQIDIYVDYTSSVYYQIPDRPAVDRWDPAEVYAIVQDGLDRDGILLAGQLGFRNDNMIVVPSSWAAERNVRTISDLAPYAKDMVFGSDLVFHAAEEDGLPHVEKVYDFTFGEVRSMDPSLTFLALQSGSVDAIVAYTTDSRITLFNLTALDDDRYAMAPYHAILLVNGKRAEDRKIINSLSPLIDAIDSDTMRRLNSRFDVDKEDPKVIAREYLVSRGLIAA